MRYSTRVVLQMTDVIGEYITVEKDEHDYNGPVALCCGPSPEEETISGEQSSLASTLRGNYNTVFGEQQQTMDQLNSTLNKISTGDTGLGFSAAEDAARQSQIINQGAANARNATQAAEDFSAGKTFNGSTDSSGLARTGGIAQQVRETAQSQADTNTANQLTKLTAANYDQGRANVDRTAAGLATLAQIQNPNPVAGAAGSELNSAFGSADKINQENNAVEADIAGAVTGAAKTGLSFASGGLSNLGPGSGVGDFFSGGLNALAGN
jgi:hypothetical protein